MHGSDTDGKVDEIPARLKVESVRWKMARKEARRQLGYSLMPSSVHGNLHRSA